MKSLVKYLLMISGILCVVLGIVGMFVPLLPTTPFLLLAAACFIRSSKRFYCWLTTNRWCGEYIRNYREGRGIPLKQKLLTLLLLWLTISYAAWFVVTSYWIRAVLFAIALGVTIHLLRIKTYKAENQYSGLDVEHNITE